MVDGSSTQASGIGLALARDPASDFIIPCWPAYYMPNNPQNTISTPALKSLSHFRSARNEALHWTKFTNSQGQSTRINSNPHFARQEVLDFVTLDFVKPNNDIMDNISISLKSEVPKPSVRHTFSKNEKLDWYTIHRRLGHVHPKKLQFMSNKNIILDLPSNLKTPHDASNCQICALGKMKQINKGKTFDTSRIMIGQLLHMDFYFWGTTSIRGFTACLLIIDARSRKQWKFLTHSKSPPLEICHWFFNQLRLSGRPIQFVQTDRGGELARSAEFCELLIHHSITLQQTAGYTSFLNGKVERHIQTCKNMTRCIHIDSGLDNKFWCFADEYSTKIYNILSHSALDGESPDFFWYNERTSIHDIRCFGCQAIFYSVVPNTTDITPRGVKGYYLGTTATKEVIRYWNPDKPNEIQYGHTAKFYESISYLPNGILSPGSKIAGGEKVDLDNTFDQINVSDNPFIDSLIHECSFKIDTKTKDLGITISDCDYFNKPFIKQVAPSSPLYKYLPANLRSNIWIIGFGNKSPRTAYRLAIDLKRAIEQGKFLKFIVAKRKVTIPKSSLEQNWSAFHQIRPLPSSIDPSTRIYVPNSPTNISNKIHEDVPQEIRRSSRLAEKHRPKVHHVIQMPSKPPVPTHIGEALKSPIKQDWKISVFKAFDKMHNSITWSEPFPITLLPKDTKLLSPRIAFAIKLTPVDHFYELSSRICANGSKMEEGIDFYCSYAPVCDADSFRLVIAVAAEEGMVGYFLDISNAFQTNVIFDPNERFYIRIPPLYMDWFRHKWPEHPILKYNQRDLCIQSLRGLQGTKHAGYEWYQLLSAIFKDLGMIPNTICKGVFMWNSDNHKAMVCVATDDILLWSTHEILYKRLVEKFNNYFKFTHRTGQELSFLNFRIIQSEYGISIDQTLHIKKSVLDPYFKHRKLPIPFCASPFPISTEFECALYNALPLDENAIQAHATKSNGRYSTHVGALLHVAEKSRLDLSYGCMRLSTYLSAPRLPCYDAVEQMMRYLYHHPHVPIMYPRKTSNCSPMNIHFYKGYAEPQSVNASNKQLGMASWSDSDFARDLVSRRSVTSGYTEYNQVAVAWLSKKQTQVSECTNSAEVRALFTMAKRTEIFRRWMTSMGRPIKDPTPIFEDNKATIAQVLKDRLTPNIKHVDVPICYLHELYLNGVFHPNYVDTSKNCADLNSKPHGGILLMQKLLWMVGERFYPPRDSSHYKLLELDKYKIGTHRGSFLSDNQLDKNNEKKNEQSTGKTGI